MCGLRRQVPMAIRQCQQAGITVRMVTGDSVRTATFIARRCGILNKGEDSLVFDGKEFNRLVRRKPNEPVSSYVAFQKKIFPGIFSGKLLEIFRKFSEKPEKMFY